MILCKFCQKEKPKEDFLLINGKIFCKCFACRQEYNQATRERRAIRYKEKQAEIIQKQKEYNEKNKGKIKERKKKYRQENKEKLQLERQKRYADPEEKLKQRLRRYKITLAEYEKLLQRSGNCCEICGSDSSQSLLDFCIDHCHSSGKVRGLLCHPCNKGLGAFFDDPEKLEKAIKYLKGLTE